MGVTARPKAYPNPPTPLTIPKLTFYANPNAKTSSPRTALNGGSYGVKSRDKDRQLCGHVYVGVWCGCPAFILS